MAGELEQVIRAVSRYESAKGKSKAVELLRHFSGEHGLAVPRIRDVPRERWGSMLSRIDNELSRVRHLA